MLSEVLMATQVWGSADQNHEEEILNMLGDVYSAANLKALHDGDTDDWFEQEIQNMLSDVYTAAMLQDKNLTIEQIRLLSLTKQSSSQRLKNADHLRFSLESLGFSA